MKKKINLSLVSALLAGFILLSSFYKTDKNDAGQNHPWTAEQVMEPGDLAAILISDSATAPLILNIGPVDDIKNAVNFGAVEHRKNLRKLKRFLKKQPRDTAIVFYCGCCAMETCPNVAPAFELLDKMGFTNFKILNIEQNLDENWISKGYPMKKLTK